MALVKNKSTQMTDTGSNKTTVHSGGGGHFGSGLTSTQQYAADLAEKAYKEGMIKASQQTPTTTTTKSPTAGLTGTQQYASDLAEKAYRDAMAKLGQPVNNANLNATRNAASGSLAPSTAINNGWNATPTTGGGGGTGGNLMNGGRVTATFPDLSAYTDGSFLRFTNSDEFNQVQNWYNQSIDNALKSVNAMTPEAYEQYSKLYGNQAADALANFLKAVRKNRMSGLTSGASTGAQSASEVQQASTLGTELGSAATNSVDATLGKLLEAKLGLNTKRGEVGEDFLSAYGNYAGMRDQQLEGSKVSAAAAKYAADLEYQTALANIAAQRDYMNAQTNYYSALANGTANGTDTRNLTGTTSAASDYANVTAGLKAAYGLTDDQANAAIGLLETGLYDSIDDVVKLVKPKETNTSAPTTITRASSYNGVYPEPILK